MFIENSRIIKKSGMRFEEDDVLLMENSLNSDVNINMRIRFIGEAFGFVIIPFDEQENDLSKNNFLIRLTKRRIDLIYNTPNNNKTVTEQSIFIDKNEFFVNFIKEKNNIKILINKKLVFETDTITTNQYKIGIYSTKYNTIENIDIKTPSPLNWNTNMKNTLGGVIRFIENGFRVMGCKKDAEIIQNNINVKQGNNYLKFKESNDSDVRPYIFIEGDKRKNDEDKNILEKIDKGLYKFYLEEDSIVVLKFKGKVGTIKEISISMTLAEDFVPTDNNNFRPGSKLIVEMNNIKQLIFKGIIKSTPLDDNYFVISNKKEKIKNSLPKDNLYAYIINKKNGKFIVDIHNPLEENNKNHIIDYKDSKPIHSQEIDKAELLEIFYNIDAIINYFVYVDFNGNIVDIIGDKELVFYVENNSIAPIIVLANGEPLELVGNYRIDNGVYKFTNYTREIFIPKRVMTMPSDLSGKEDSITLYGVKKENIINKDALYSINKIDNISMFAKDYDTYNQSDLQVIREERKIIFEEYRKYDFVVVDYLSGESYTINKIPGTNTHAVAISSEEEDILLMYEGKEYKSFDDGKKIVEVVAEDKQYIVLEEKFEED